MIKPRAVETSAVKKTNGPPNGRGVPPLGPVSPLGPAPPRRPGGTWPAPPRPYAFRRVEFLEKIS